jgi:hypothetical protein
MQDEVFRRPRVMPGYARMRNVRESFWVKCQKLEFLPIFKQAQKDGRIKVDRYWGPERSCWDEYLTLTWESDRAKWKLSE